MPNKYLKSKARAQKQAEARRRQQENLKNEISRLHEQLLASIDNAMPLSTWLPRMSVRLRKFLSKLPRQKPRSKKELE
jgi:hypothetical protein